MLWFESYGRLQGFDARAVHVGPLCPLLHMLAPLFVMSNLISSRCQTKLDPGTIQWRLAHTVLSDHPTTLFSVIAIFGQWIVTTTIFIDLEYDSGPIVFFCLFWAFECGALWYVKQKKWTWVDSAVIMNDDARVALLTDDHDPLLSQVGRQLATDFEKRQDV